MLPILIHSTGAAPRRTLRPTLKTVEINAVNSMIKTSLRPSIMKDTRPSSKEIKRSITLKMERRNAVKIASRLWEKNELKDTSISPSINMAMQVLAPNRYWVARPPDPWQSVS